MKTRNSASLRRNTITGLILAAPILLGTIVFFAVPFLITIYFSLTFGVGGAEFVGISNYIKVFSSPAFKLAAFNTLRFIAIGVPLIMIISFVIAMLLQKKFGGTKLFRSILLFPLTVPIASFVMVVQILFANNGIINSAMYALGAPIQDFLNSPSAFNILIGLYVWKNCGYNVILMLAGLNMIPRELYESASLEGANILQKFKKITFPLIVPNVFFVFVMSIINSFKTYREAFLLGGKHPHDSIYSLQHFVNNNFENLNYQRLSVAAIILFAFVFLLVAVMYYLQNKYGEASQ